MPASDAGLDAISARITGRPQTAGSESSAHRTARSERDRLISAAVAQGKFPGSRRVFWAAKFDADPTGTKAAIGMLTAVPEIGQAARAANGPRAAAAPVRAGTSLGERREYMSLFARGEHVTIDPYGRNPLLDDLQQVMPSIVATAKREGPVPTLFETGDLPPFTASGIDPQDLLRLPWGVRHAAAASPDRGRVMAMFEAYARDPDAVIQGPGRQEYIGRMHRWASGW